MRMSQRQVVLALLSLMTAGMILLFAYVISIAALRDAISTLLAALLFGGVLVAYWRGVDWSRYVGIAAFTLLVGFSLTDAEIRGGPPAAIVLVPVVALLLGDLRWVVGSSTVLFAIVVVRTGGQTMYLSFVSIAIWTLIVAGLVLSRMVADTAQRDAEESARRAEDARAKVEANPAELTRKAEELTRQNEEQRRLIDLVATLETPAVALAEGVIFAPVVGHLDSRRAAGLTDRLLRDVSASRARLVVLDITGVPAVDTAVAQALLRAVQAVRLLGCDVTITGISATIAATMTELGINMSGVHTTRTPQEALEQALAKSAVAAPNGARKN